MSTTPISEEAQILQFLQHPSPVKGVVALSFAAKMLAIFGLRYGAYMEGHSKGALQQYLNTMRRVLPELQNGLCGGKTLLCEFPETQTLVDTSCPYGVDKGEYFEQLKKSSYEILPFAQRALMYKTPEVASITAIESVRRRAFALLMRQLNTTAPQALSAEEEIAVSALYFNGGAVIRDGGTVYFSELSDLWREQTRKEVSFTPLAIGAWIQKQSRSIPRLAHSELLDSFQTFLALYSLETVERNLGVSFSQSMKTYICDLFQKDEQLRSDMVFFTADLQCLYGLDFTRFNRTSTQLLLSLQVFLYMVRSFGVSAEKQATLLHMLVCRGEQWKLESLHGFQERNWLSLCSPSEEDSFTKAWKGMETILASVSKHAVSLSDPSPQDQILFKNPLCWPLFFFLWQTGPIDDCVSLFSKLGERPEISLTIPMIYQFCITHNLSSRRAQCVSEKYMHVLKIIEDHQMTPWHAELLFLDPPISELETTLENAPENTKRFIEKMKTYHLGIPIETFLRLLRGFLSNPSDVIFDLLEDAAAFTVRIEEELLLGAFFVGAPASISPAVRNHAKGITSKIQDLYHFSDENIFFLYLEIIRLLIANQETRIGSMSQVIHALMDFFPLEKQEIYFLFLYHPDVTIAQVLALVSARDEWARSGTLWNRGVIDPKVYAEIEKQIGDFVAILSAACSNREVKGPFEVTCQQSLLSAFFPPLQPLTDSLRIAQLTQQHGVTWTSRALKTHVGQLKFISGMASLGIYCHVTILKGFPVLFLSFFDINKQAAYSSFLPLRVQAARIEAEENNIVFYALLLRLSQAVLRERATQAPESDTLASWRACYPSATTVVESFSNEIQRGTLLAEDVVQILDFLRQVQIAYQTLFLSSVAGQRPPPPSCDPQEVASCGHVFSSHKRGSLLPLALLEVQVHPECYLPDADDVHFALSCVERGIFNHPNAHSEPLQLTLSVAKGNDKDELPISYHVQSLSQERALEIGAEAVSERIQNNSVTLSVQWPEDGSMIKIPLQYPPTALTDAARFQRYFDYHNLLLKAAVYYIRSQ